MKFIESKPKTLIYTILLMIFAMFEMGVLSGFRFAEFSDKYLYGLTNAKVMNVATLGANVGWNYVTCSFLIILGLIGYSALLGYNRNPGGLIAIVVMNVVPAIGFVFSFNFFVGYGYSLYTPAMGLFGLTFCDTKAQQIANNAIFAGIVVVLCIAAWLVGKKVRSNYAAKYEIEFD